MTNDDGDAHGECAAEISRLELAIALNEQMLEQSANQFALARTALNNAVREVLEDIENGDFDEAVERLKEMIGVSDGRN